MQVFINNHWYLANPGETILTVARRNGISIPTLCHHDGLEPWGGCRLCVVEMWKDDAADKKVTISCMQPAEDGLKIDTDSPRVREIRAQILELLLARAPRAEILQQLAREYGVTSSSYVPIHQPASSPLKSNRVDPDRCILCALCLRACAAVGAHALSTAGRGAQGEISLFFGDDPADCVGCGACALTCPTGAIALEDVGLERRIWGRRFERIPCSVCGRPTLTPEYSALLSERSGLPSDSFLLCDACRREAHGKKILSVMGR